MVPPHATACQFYFSPSPCCSTGPARPLRPSLGVILVLHELLRPSVCIPGVSPGLTHSGTQECGSKALRQRGERLGSGFPLQCLYCTLSPCHPLPTRTVLKLWAQGQGSTNPQASISCLRSLKS